MKANRVFIVTIAIVVMAWTAESALAQFNFGVRAGWNFSDLGMRKTEEYLAGSTIGATAEYYLPSSLGFRTGLFYSRKGSAYMEGWFFRDIKDYMGNGKIDDNFPFFMNAGLDYLDIPIEVRYKFPLDEKARITVGVGGYIGYGIGGRMNVRYKDDGITREAFKDTSDPNDAGKRMLKGFAKTDYGAKVDVEFIYRHFVMGISYQHGLRTLNNALPVDMGHPARNRTLNISVGYNFK